VSQRENKLLSWFTRNCKPHRTSPQKAAQFSGVAGKFRWLSLHRREPNANFTSLTLFFLCLQFILRNILI
jgi:hypothetical protein